MIDKGHSKLAPMKHRDDLIRKYQAGQLSKEEWAWLIDDLRQNPDYSAYQPILQQWQGAELAKLLSPDDSRRLLHVFQRRRQVYSEKSARRSRLYYQAAAVSGLLLIGAITWFLLRSNPLVERTVGYGEMKTLVLPDSSVVTLNANSTIRYAMDWDTEDIREVWLDGEAYFSVVHTQHDQPFIVHITDDLRVNVLGTEFNVKDRRNEAAIVLYEGKINLAIDRVREPSETIEMKPGDLVEVLEGTKNVEKRVISAERYLAWRDRMMIFEKESLQKIARQLEDIHGVTISIENDSLASTRLTGALPTENLETVLVSLQVLIPMQVERNENQIIFKQK